MELYDFKDQVLRFSDEPWMNELKLFSDDRLSVFYSPFEYVNTGARVVLCGITPGRTQAIKANMIARDKLLSGATISDAQEAAKAAASFDKLRSNLSAMLDEIGLNKLLDIDSCEQLFGLHANMVHYTSAIRYPTVLASGDGYNGTPRPDAHPYLRQIMDKCLASEAETLADCIWVPLGKGAGEAMDYLIRQGVLTSDRVLRGLPHPSGANAERVAYFLGRKSRSQLSNKTNPDSIDAAKVSLINQVRAI